MTLLSKPLPNNKESEKVIISQLIHQPEDFHKITQFVKAEYFFDLKYKFIYECILKAYEQHKTIDIALLYGEIRKTEPEFSIDLNDEFDWGNVGCGMNTARNALQLQQSYKSRQYIHAGVQIIQNAYTKELSEVSELAQKAIYDISKENDHTEKVISFSDGIGKLHQELVERKKDNIEYKISSGFPSLDSKIKGGFRKGSLITIGGRPAMGKTSLAMNMALEMAKQGKKVCFFSLEMLWQDILIRAASGEALIPGNSIEDLTYLDNKDEMDKIYKVFNLFLKLGIKIDYTVNLSIQDLITKARRRKMEDKTDIIFIDFLQRIVAKKKYEAKYLEIGDYTNKLKSLAMELEIPIVLLSQLSRDVEKRMDKRPMQSDLRESGSIEQDSDLILLVYRDIVYNKDANPYEAEILVSKNKFGPECTLTMNFDGEFTKFSES